MNMDIIEKQHIHKRSGKNELDSKKGVLFSIHEIQIRHAVCFELASPLSNEFIKFIVFVLQKSLIAINSGS